MENGRDIDAIVEVRVDELRRDVARLEERTQAFELRLARLEGREEERDDRARRTAETRLVRDRRELAAKVVAGTVTVALAIVSAIVSIVTAAKC